MRFSEIELQCEDIMWFGVDRKGHIFECTSGGFGSVPEFVCCSKENTDALYNFFMNELDKLTDYNLLVEDNGYPLSEDGKSLAEKGIFCYDVSDDNDNEYRKISYPSKAISLYDLPEQVQNLLKTHVIDIDVSERETINVKHAY